MDSSTCHNLGKKGHYVRVCKGKKEIKSSINYAGTNDKRKKNESSKVKTVTKDDVVEQKWRSVPKTISHDGAECHTQGELRLSEDDNAHHASSAAVLSAASPPL